MDTVKAAYTYADALLVLQKDAELNWWLMPPMPVAALTTFRIDSHLHARYMHWVHGRDKNNPSAPSDLHFGQRCWNGFRVCTEAAHQLS